VITEYKAQRKSSTQKTRRTARKTGKQEEDEGASERVHSSEVEQLTFNERVEGSNPSVLKGTEGPRLRTSNPSVHKGTEGHTQGNRRAQTKDIKPHCTQGNRRTYTREQKDIHKGTEGHTQGNRRTKTKVGGRGADRLRTRRRVQPPQFKNGKKDACDSV
jgi:hypothetical protein